MKPCDPNDCAVTQRLDIKRSTREEKQRLAEWYYSHGWIEERIAEALEVDQATISRWLANLCTPHKSKPAKTKTNPKGAGRPKGSRKPRGDRKPHHSEAEIIALWDAGKSYKEIERLTGLGRSARDIIEREAARRNAVANAQPEIDAKSLSMTAQQRLDVAIRQRQRELEQEFDRRVLAEVEHRMDHIVLPAWRDTIEWAEAVSRREKGVLTVAEYKMLRACLHPDRVQDETLKRKFSDAFGIIERLEKFLCKPEKEPPAKFPRTWQEAQSSMSERVL
jgi:hypothetical protein